MIKRHFWIAASLALSCVLIGCTTTPYLSSSPCAAQPGDKQCEIERYLNAP